MKQILTLTTLAAIFAFSFADAQQATFSFGKAKTAEQLSNDGWDMSNVASIKNFLYIKSSVTQTNNYTVMATPYLNIKANDAIQLNYRFADAMVGVYAEDVQGNVTRIAELAAGASSQKIVIPQAGKQRIIVKLEKSSYAPANLIINSISFNDYSLMAYTDIPSKDMSIKKMQDTPDQLMMPSPSANNTDNNTTTSSITK
jgi:hypothetical protein